jgi:hypothetical protein
MSRTGLVHLYTTQTPHFQSVRVCVCVRVCGASAWQRCRLKAVMSVRDGPFPSPFPTLNPKPYALSPKALHPKP